MRVELNDGKVAVIFWRHFRNDIEERLDGVTQCVIREYVEGEKDPYNVISSVAECVKPDNYNKSIGRKISLTRTLKEFDITKEEKTKIWDRFFTETKSG